MKFLHKFFDKDILPLLGHSRNYLSSEVIGNLLAFITVPIFTRILSPSDYGIIYIFGSFVSVLTIILSLGLRGAIKINYVKKKYPHGEYLATNLLFITFLSIFFVFILFLCKNIISETFKILPFVFLLSAITSFLGIYPEIFLNMLQIEQKSKQYAIINIIKNLSVTFISIFVILLMTKDLYLGKIYTTIGVSTIVTFYSIFQLLKQSSFNLRLIYIQDALRFSLPMIPHLLSGFILSFFDRIIINQIVGSAAAGIYSLAYQFGIIMNMVVMNMNMAWQPLYWQMITDKAWQKMNKLAHKYAKYIYICALGLIFFSKEVVLLLVDKAYFEAISILPAIIFSYLFVFLYTLFSAYTLYSKQTGLISINTFIAGATNIALNYYYIPIYGYAAAAYTTLFSYFLLFVLHYLSVRYVLKFDKLKLRAVFPDFFVLVLVLTLFFTTTIWITNYPFLLLLKIFLMLSTFYYYFKINNKSEIV